MKRRSLIISLVAIVVISVGGVIATLVTDTKPQLGLDLQGGASVTLQPVGKADPEALTVVTDILRNRIDSLGVAEPEIIRQGNTVIVNLPGIKDQDRAIQLVGQTGKVLFRPVLSERRPPPWPPRRPAPTTVPARPRPHLTPARPRSPRPAVATTTATGSGARPAATPGGAATTTLAPEVAAQITPRDQDKPEASVVLLGRGGQTIYQLGPAFALGENAISTAEAGVQNGQWVVDLKLKEGNNGLGAWNTWASKCYGQEADCPPGGMAIVLDGTVIAAPVPQTPTSPTPTSRSRAAATASRRARPRTWPGCQVRQRPGRAETPGGPDRLGHAGQGLPARPPDRRSSASCWCCPDDPLLPDAGHLGRGRPVPGRLPALDVHLDPVEASRISLT